MRFKRLIKDNKPKILAFFRAQRAVTSVEFALTSIPLVLLLAFFAEICRIVYLSTAIDLTVAQAGRFTAYSSNAENNSETFTRMLKANIGHWPLLTQNQKIDVAISFCKNIDEHLKNNCQKNFAQDRPIGVYNITYRYSAMFFSLPEYFVGSVIRVNGAFVNQAVVATGDSAGVTL